MNTLEEEYQEALSSISSTHILRFRDWLVSVGAGHINNRGRSLIVELGSHEITVADDAALRLLLDVTDKLLGRNRTDISVSDDGEALRIKVSGPCPIIRVTKLHSVEFSEAELEEIRSRVAELPSGVVVHVEVGTDSWEPVLEDLNSVLNVVSEALDGDDASVLVTRSGIKLNVVPEHSCVECSSCA